MPTPESMRLNTVRILPLLAATASTTYALSEAWTLLPFFQPSISSSALSTWFNSWLYHAIAGVITLGATSVITGYLGWKNSVGAARTMFGWGTVFAAGHFVYVPVVSRDQFDVG